ncbi:glycosyltransferase [Paenibacillus harenae]|uniref:glycosyltransferase n=1 Tax=Paenibacillus harenae TaxID=306543 RepID=UPI0004197EAD|nr:glycosyltransferase [Paenibacillus harenae]
MKILFTIHDLQTHGGSETLTYTLIEQLINQGHELFLYSSRLGKVVQRFQEYGIIVSDDFNDFPEDIDLIHAQHIAEAFAAYTKYQYVPMVFVCHGILPWQEIPLKIPNIYKYIAVSEEVKLHLIDKHNIAENLIQIIRNCVNLDRFKKTNEFNETPKKLLLLSNRYTEEVENTLINLCKLRNMEFEVVGKTNNVWNTSEIIQRSDIVVTLGRGVLEAAACGKCVIIYDYNGGDGILTPSNYHLLREKNFSGRTMKAQYNTDELNELINESYYEENVLKNIELIKENHDARNVVKEFESLYRPAVEWASRMKYINVPSNISVFSDIYMFIGREVVQKEKNLSYLLEVIEELKGEIEERERVAIKQADDLKNLVHIVDKLNEQIRLYESEVIKNKSELAKMEQVKFGIEQKCQELEKNVEQLQSEVSQKENNTLYLMELNREKDKEVDQIYKSRAWKTITAYRDFKRRVIKALRNPKWAVKKMLQIKPKYISNYKPLVSKTDLGVEQTNNPLVSVVIPIYDRTDVLIKSIESILNQTYSNIELLLVCDGSPKPTLEIVKIYENHPKVRVFYFFNNSGNAVRGRNKAIKEARGKYLAFQDSDDIADPKRIETSLLYLEKYKVDIVYGGWRAIVDGSRVIDIEDKQEIFSPDCDYSMLSEICVPCQSTVMAKLDALREVGGLKTAMKYREDHELWLRLSYFGFKFKSVPEILTNLRLHDNNLELSFKNEDDHWLKLMKEEHKIKGILKPKIAYVIPGCGISGGIAVICQHANRLLERGYDVVMVTEDDKTSIDWFPNQKVQIIPLTQAPDNLDIIIATGWSTAYTVLNIPSLRKFYFVQSDESRFHESDSRDYKLTVDTYKMDFEFMTEAKWIQGWLKSTFNKDSYYVPNGLDEEIIYQTQPIVSKGNKIRVLLEGPIDIPYKGMEDAFLAVKDLDCEIWCISSAGKPREGWRCDYFFEKVPMEKMRDIYSSCDIILKMSRVEGFFGPPLEMMACGGACVVSEVTGYDEYIVDGYNALVVKMGDIEGAKQAVNRLILDIDLRNKLIENGRVTANEWKWEPTIDTLESIFMDGLNTEL